MIKKHFKNRAVGPALLAIVPVLKILIAAGTVITIGFLAFKGLLKKIPEGVLAIIDFVSSAVLLGVNFLFNLFASIARYVINIFASLNPFEYGGAAQFLWEFFKNISYLVLVFLALYSGINWILNREEQARRILFGVLLIAFLINFTFLLAKELFLVVTFLQRSILLSANLVIGDSTKLGDLIYTVFSIISPIRIVGELKELNFPFYMEEHLEDDNIAILQRSVNIAANLTGIVLSLIYSLNLWAFAGLFIARYFIISFLVGLLPLAVIAYVTPGYEKHWHNWWHWFLNWTFNVLILIILILIGVSLVATTSGGGEGIFSETKLMDKVQQFLEKEIGLNDDPTAMKLSFLFGYTIKIVFIAIYFYVVMRLTLQLGGRFAEYGYGLAQRGWGLIGKALTGTALWAVRPTLTKLGSKISSWGEVLSQNRFEFIRGLGHLTEDIGKKLQAPAKERAREDAERIYSHIKDLPPEEQARRLEKYGGLLQEELAKIMNRELSEENLLKVASNLNLQREKINIIKALCGRKLRCVLTSLREGRYVEALPILADIIDHKEFDLANMSQLLKTAGAKPEQIEALIPNYIVNYLGTEDLRDLFYNPQNIQFLAQELKVLDQVKSQITDFTKYLEQSPAYRAIGELSGVLAEGSPALAQKIHDRLTAMYSEGKLTADKLKKWRESLQQQKELPGDFKEIFDDINNEIDTSINQLQNNLKTIEENLESLRQQKTPGIINLDLDNQIRELESQQQQIQAEIDKLNQLKSAISTISQSKDFDRAIEILGKIEGIFRAPYPAVGRRALRSSIEEMLRRMQSGQAGASS